MADDIVLQRIQQQFEGRAPTYDSNNTYHPPLADRLLQLLDLQSGDRLLDLGAGTGIVGLAAAAAVGEGGSVALVDLCQAMLDQARSKYEASVLPSNCINDKARTADNAVQPDAPAEELGGLQLQQQQQLAPAHFFLGDMEHLDSCLPAEWLGSFTAITCSAAVPFLQHPTATFASWRDWLKQPGGKLALNAFVPPAVEDYGTFVRLAEQFGFPAEFDPSEVLGSTERVTAALKQAGYINIQASCT
jgi:SAM-dependent methyltransferase